MESITRNVLTDFFEPLDGETNLNENGGITVSPSSAFFSGASNPFASTVAANFVGNDKNQSLVGSGAPSETFWVKKSDKAEKISENLLLENFGFEEIDVKAYRALYGDLKIFDEKQCAASKSVGKSCDWATTEQLQNWRASADGKMVAVNLPEATVKFLRDFRHERLIERRVMEIGDLQMRGRVENGLRAAVTKTGEARADAFVDLRNVLEDDSPDGKRAAAVVKLIANLPENKENPFTQILLAKIELKEIYSGENVMFDPKTVVAIEQRINRAADSASGYSDASRTRNPKNAVSRAEAQALNEEAARLADRFGQPSDARFRRVMARFYAVDDAERSRYETMRFPQTATLPSLKNEPTASMSATPKETLALEQFRRENPPQGVKKDLAEDPQKRQIKVDYLRNENGQKVLDKEGKPIIKQEANFQIEGSMKPTGIQSNTTYIYKDGKGNIVPESRGYNRKMPVTTKQTTERDEINSAGTGRVFRTAGAVGAIEEINKWTPFLVDLYRGTTAKKVAVREKLEKAEFDANNFPVPPKPERIQQMKRDLISVRFNTQNEFQTVQLTMKRLEDLSYAFWNR